VTRLEVILRRVLSDLARLRPKLALIGGVAVSARTEFRFTRDIDLVIAVAHDQDAERIVGTLIAAGYQALAMLEQTATNRLATMRLLPSGEPLSGVIVDLLFASSGIEPEIVAAADSLEVFRGFRVPVARTSHLIALKVLSRNDDTRPQDTADLRALLLEATPDDLSMARAALDLIAERGYARGKDLQADLDALIARFLRTG
jgi:hypothetical protein